MHAIVKSAAVARQAPTTGILRGGIFARTDPSMFRCARTSSWGVNANHCASGTSSNLGLLNISRRALRTAVMSLMTLELLPFFYRFEWMPLRHLLAS